MLWFVKLCKSFVEKKQKLLIFQERYIQKPGITELVRIEVKCCLNHLIKK